MAHVFISYKRKKSDEDFALLLKHNIETAGFEAKIDREFLALGENWREAIDEAIRTAFAIVTIITPEARASEFVTYEWACAWGAKIKVIPILLEITQVHPQLERLQYLDFTNHFDQPWDELIKKINSSRKGISFRTRTYYQISC